MKKQLLILFLAVGLSNLTAQNVLIIHDGIPAAPTNASLQTALQNAGFTVNFSSVIESQWDNTNPSLLGFDAVIHMNGLSPASNFSISIAAQQALVAFVQNGGYYISSEWNAFEHDFLGTLSGMTDLVLFKRSTGTNGTITLEKVPAQANHSVMANIPSSFVLGASHNVGTIRTFNTNPSLVLMTQSGNDAVAVRDLGQGKVLGFHHAGNYNDANTGYAVWMDQNIQQIIINFLNQQSLSTTSFEPIDQKVYPNPVVSTLNVETTLVNLKKLELFSVLGEKVAESHTAQLDMSELQSGMYLLKLVTEQGITTQKIIKQ